MSLAKLCIILVRPKHSGNIGATARAMGNVGIQALRVVAPPAFCRQDAEIMAVHARGLLDTMRIYSSLREAIADCGLVVGTTCRPGLYREAPSTPRDIAPKLAAALNHNQVAYVFGPEDTGLTNADLRYCHQLVTIPTAFPFRSLNVAQAALVCCYELFLATQQQAQVPDESFADQDSSENRRARQAPGALAVAERQELMYDKLQQALLSIGFLHRDNPEHIMFALRRILGRAGLEDRDVRILLGLARQISWYAGSGWRTQPPETSAPRGK